MEKIKTSTLQLYVKTCEVVKSAKLPKAYTATLMAFVMVVYSAQATHAATSLATFDMFDKVKEVMGSLYTAILAISTGAALLITLIALLFRMFATNPRTIETATMWIKRVIVTWIFINVLGFIFTFLKDLTSDGAAQWDEFVN